MLYIYTFLHFKYIVYDRAIIPALLAIMPAQVYVCWHNAPRPRLIKKKLEPSLSKLP